MAVPDRIPESVPGHFDRAANLSRLTNEEFDVLVIGGGITGAGVALDAASRGLRTALVEKDDFASGTSSKSSKLVHGGLRYLQQHEYRLVYESLAERQHLLDNAPHLVTPLPFLIPLFGNGAASAGAARLYRTALWIYDVTGGTRIGHRHQRVSRAEVSAHLPTLRVDRLAAGFLYWDARADDARLTLTVVRTAVLDHGAVAINHAPVTGLVNGPDGQVRGARVAPVGGDPIDVRATVVVNATGVWSDEVRTLDEHRHPGSIRPAKGIHITVPAQAFPCDIAAVIPVREDGRSIFAVSWGDQVYLGTTDTAWDGPLDDPACLPEDIAYLVAAANAVTTSPIGPGDISGVWSGLRPLLAQSTTRRRGRPPRRRGGHSPLGGRTADLSRRHRVHTSAAGVVTVTGGKLTTYRKMAEDTVDVVVRSLGRPQLRCTTRHLRLRGANGGLRVCTDQPADRPEAIAAHLAGRFGSETPQVLALVGEVPGLLDPLVDGLRYLRVEALYAVREEMARSLADILDRRTRASLRDARAAARAARAVAELVGPELGWDRARVSAEAEAYAGRLVSELVRAGLDPTGGPVPADRALATNDQTEGR